jgi:L-amino acid N-acyltransferase
MKIAKVANITVWHKTCKFPNLNTMSVSKRTIRNATVSDVPFILEIINDAILNSTALYHYQPQTLEQRLAWFNDRISNNFPVIVAVEDETILGFGSYGAFRAFPGYKYTVEHSVYVHPNHRSKGVATLILEWLIKNARESDYHVIVAAIDSENDISIKMHLKYGFKSIGCMKQVGYKFGKWLNVEFLQLVFDTPTNPVEN